MLTSLALIFLVGLSAAGICRRLKLLRIIGMLITGIVLGPMRWIFWIRRFCPYPQNCARRR